MRFYLIFSIHLIAFFQVSGKLTAQHVTVQVQNAPLEAVFASVKAQSGYVVVYNSNELKQVKVTLNLKQVPVERVIVACLADLHYSYVIQGNHILIKKTVKSPGAAGSSGPAAVQQREVRGRVTNELGEPLAGVTVAAPNHGVTTVTDNDGNYRLRLPAAANVLSFSMVGHAPHERPVAEEPVVDVVLRELVSDLDEVVVVGFGQQKRATVTGALSSIGTKELLQSPQANISNMLVGRLPGLLAVQRSGQPGADQSTLRIRGVGTFSGSQTPLILVDGIEGVNFNSLDPNEIDNIAILKDASATAVYGVRGANGVILITTKKGVIGKPKISFSSNFASTSFTDVRESARAHDYVVGFNEALKYDSYITGGYNEKYTAEEIEYFRTGSDPIFYPDVDWFSTVYKPRSGQMHHNLNVSGGVERVKYFISAGFFNQEGLFNETITNFIKEYDTQPKYNRYNFRSNLDFDIAKGLKANLNVSYQMEERRGLLNNINARLEVVTRSNPVNSPGIVDGKPITLGVTGPAGAVLGAFLQDGYQRRYHNHLNGSIRLDYDLDFITPGLHTHGTLSYMNFNAQNGTFFKRMVDYLPVRLPDQSLVYVPQATETPFSFSEDVAKNRREYLEFAIQYDRQFGSHEVGALLLYNQNKLHDPTLAFLIPRGYQGLVGRITYNYKARYMAEFDAGYNGTENFAEGRRFGFFPAFSAGWTVSEEPFFPDNRYLSYLKFRGSYGEVGNDQVGGDRFLYLPSSYNYVDNYYAFGEIGGSYNNYRASTEGKIGNPLLTWERAKKKNIGLEAKFLDDKLQLTADWFDENRDNILANLGTVSYVVGANLPAANFGRMRNRGVDGDISFNGRVSNLLYWIKANYTFARNTIEFQDEVNRLYDYQYRTGQSHGQHFGLIADGFYNTWEEVNAQNRPQSQWNNNRLQPGDVRYRDVNGDGAINIDDMAPIGYSNFPEKIAGLSLGGSFKGIDFSVLFQSAWNVSVSYSRNFRYGYREEAGVPQYILDYSWTHERYANGDEIRYPHLSEGDVNQAHNYQASSLWVRDASYVRLKNAEVGYTFGEKVTKKLGIASMRVYTNGNNLLTWSSMFKGVDPESHIAGTNNEPYPLTRTINVGLNINL